MSQDGSRDANNSAVVVLPADWIGAAAVFQRYYLCDAEGVCVRHRESCLCMLRLFITSGRQRDMGLFGRIDENRCIIPSS